MASVFGNATWRQLKIRSCLKLNKFRNVPVILLNWGAEILIIKWATWRGFLWERVIWFSDPVLNSICWSKKSYREKMRESLSQSCALDFLPTEWKCGIFFFFCAIFLGNRASAVSLWCSVTLDLMADFFQTGWRFWQKAGSCGMRCLGKGEFPDPGQGLPWEPQHWDTRAFPGARSRGHLAQGEALVGRSTQAMAHTLRAGALPVHFTGFRLPQLLAWSSDFCTGKRFICTYAKSGYFVYPCLHDRGRFLKESI